MKKILSIILTVLLIGFNTVKASNIIDFNKKGSLEITLVESENNEKVSNAKISIIKIADAYKDTNSNLSYKYVSKLNGCEISLKDVNASGLNNIILNYLNKNNIELEKNTTVTNSNGNVKFTNLDLGLYLIIQDNELEGYSSFEPYLVTIPTIEENDWVYDIESEPKTEIIKVVDLTINKVWKNDKNNNPDSVEIQLLKGSDVIETVTLSKENNWTYTFNRIKKSDNYSIQEINIPKGYEVSYTNDGYNFTAINSAKLPQTGFYTFIIPILVVIGMMLIIVGLMIEKKEKMYE